MNQEYTTLKEIEFIIDNDAMNSTYKLALCKGAIEISQNHAEKAFLSSESGNIIFPFSYITAYFIRYYYPIFEYPSFIPQLTAEDLKTNDTRRSVFRRDFAPIIEYYSQNGGLPALWEQMQNDTISPLIKGEWNTLCKKIKTTVVNQPMKLFGTINSKQIYPIFRLIPDYLPDEYFEDFPGCSVGNDFFSYPMEYHNLFKNISHSQLLIDKINQRWCSFTTSLLDETSRISSEQVREILSSPINETTVTDEGTVTPIEDNNNIFPGHHFPQLAPLIKHSLSGENSDTDPDILSFSAEDVIRTLHETIDESYADLIAVQSEWDEADNELSRINTDIEKSEASVQKIMDRYGITCAQVSEALPTLERQRGETKVEISFIEQKNDRRRSELSNKLQKLTQEKQDLELILTQATDEYKELEEKRKEILDLFEEYERRERYYQGMPPAFGYVGKPIKRFLTHCDTIALDFLLQSIHLFIAKKNHYVEPNTQLPEWFIAPFEDWWNEKTANLRRERRGGGSVSHNPSFIFDPGHRELTLVIPVQHIQSKRPLEEVVFVVQTSSELIYEESHPLYHEGQGFATDEIHLPIRVPSETYHVEMVYQDASKRFPPIEIFSSQQKYACFDYETGRLLARDSTTIENSAYVIFSEPITVQPESAIIESGQFYGSWQGYSYYFIDPQYSGGDRVEIGVSSETDRPNHQLYPSVTLEEYHSLDKILVNGKTTLNGAPPAILLSLPSGEYLDEYRLSIHPLTSGTFTETRFYSYDDFKDHCSLSANGTACRFDLSSDHYLGKNAIGTYAIRLRNPKRSFNHIFEFSIIPGLSVSLSKPLYLPQRGANGSVVLTLGGPQHLRCSVDKPCVAQKKKDSWTISAPLMKDVHGTLTLDLPGKIPFTAAFSHPVPHLSWRFENPEKDIICPIQRNSMTISDSAYDELGDGKELTVFLPEEYSGKGMITVNPGDNYILKAIKNGKAIFPLARFNDMLRETHAKNYSFDFSFESDKWRFETHLFDLDIWEISAFESDIATDNEKRELAFSWHEIGNVPRRKMVIWRANRGEGTPQKKDEIEIPAGARSLSISQVRSNYPPGVYYAQFVRIRDEWSSTSLHFPGERTPNLFQFSIELEGNDLLQEGDDLLATGQYIDAIERYMELEQLNPQLNALWVQKIQNTFMYTFRYDEVMTLFSELLREKDFLKSTDYAYITFRVFDCLKRPDKLTYETFYLLFAVLELIMNFKDETTHTIISSKLHDFDKAVNMCPALNEEQMTRIQKWILNVRYYAS